jgi:hypothetical protein
MNFTCSSGSAPVCASADQGDNAAVAAGSAKVCKAWRREGKFPKELVFMVCFAKDGSYGHYVSRHQRSS